MDDEELFDHQVTPASADGMRAKLAAGEVQPDHFEISLEFPSGEYYRRRP